MVRLKLCVCFKENLPGQLGNDSGHKGLERFRQGRKIDFQRSIQPFLRHGPLHCQLNPWQFTVDVEHDGPWIEATGLIHQAVHTDGKAQGRQNLSIHGLLRTHVKIHGF